MPIVVKKDKKKNIRTNRDVVDAFRKLASEEGIVEEARARKEFTSKSEKRKEKRERKKRASRGK